MNRRYQLVFCFLVILIYPALCQVVAEEESIPEPFIDPDDMPGPVDDIFLPDPFPPVIGGDVGWFRITSDPSHAEVIFDGSLVGYTPITVEVYTTGAPYHTVRIEKSGYKPWSRELHENPAAGETKTIHATLGPDPCCKSLRITSAPSGAQITLNGVYQGTTPKTIDNLVIGTYQVTLTRSGYETWHGNIQVRPDSDNTIYVVLEPSFAPITSGTLMIESYPEGAEIVLDQTSRGTTPRTLTLPEGSHTLVLNRAGYQQYTTSVFTRDKENARITAYLVPVGTTPVQTPIPVIVASPVSDAPSYPLSYESLTVLGEKAAAEAHQNRNSFLAAVNDPQGVFAGDTEFVSVLAENGTLLADPAAETWIGEEIATYMDQNTVPYGQARQALARHGGGMLYENYYNNTSSAGELLISEVRPEEDGLIITTSRRMQTAIPILSEATIASLTSVSETDGNKTGVPYQQLAVPADPNDTTGQGGTIFEPDRNGISLLPVIYALASEGGGLMYGIEPDGTDITLFYVFPETDGQVLVRWVSEPGREHTEGELIHS
ncbi:PEGA domain-containing protein [Methanospirillum hungatei]|jgi:hypothetical protein|uniref:PEGA domain-containing protein n=1 Tax=Methanospirillum hungatei TaxID=2203 RepID=UPI001B66293F|nr:PEGA domain-containing protein [Methanospirillum hungatei]MBP9008702.1 PEGA domain-containing protein [Methanospirillum sp.]HOW04814.1 PEGA domain-containing protein [Methanospirillum hungatei]